MKPALVVVLVALAGCASSSLRTTNVTTRTVRPHWVGPEHKFIWVTTSEVLTTRRYLTETTWLGRELEERPAGVEVSKTDTIWLCYRLPTSTKPICYDATWITDRPIRVR